MAPEPVGPPPGYLEGLRLFDAGAYWEAHEALEEAWLRLEAGAPELLFYQGLIQLAAGFHNALVTGRLAGAARSFEEARKKLELYRPRYGGLEVDFLCERAAALRDSAARGEVPRGLVFPMRWAEVGR